jgi:16S rRNA (cytosine967-C5)-methyltransferase
MGSRHPRSRRQHVAERIVTASRARRVAREVVSQVRERSAYAHEVLDARLKRHDLLPEDSALATRLAYGTLQSLGTLDEVLERYTGGKKLEPQVRDALRVATCEILFLQTPDRAAVHQGVELVRSVRTQAAGLANAVLRRVAEDAATFPWGDPDSDVTALARLHGHPLWLAQTWVSELGWADATEVMAANNEPAPLYVAVNPFASRIENAIAALEADGAGPRHCPVHGCIAVGHASAAVRGTALREGLVVACDAAAQAVARLTLASAGQRIVEVGAGRGTKTLLLQGQALESGAPAEITAVDIHEYKTRLLTERLAKLGVPGVSTILGDARDISAIVGAPEAGTVDAVLVDAPCSGLGTLRRHPDKRWRLDPADIGVLADLGASLLRAACSLVRPGGLVVYSTCTVTRRENQEVVNGFLGSEAGRDWRIDPLGSEMPAEWERFITAEGYFSSFPVSGGPDGHFAARLVREA